MWSRCCGSRQPNTAGHRPAIVLTGTVISNQTAIKSSTGISWRNCPSNAVRRTFAQNSSIGKTCVNVKSRTCGAITNVAKSRHSLTRSIKIPRYWRVVPRPHWNRASRHTRHCSSWCIRDQSNRFFLLANIGMDWRKLWQNNPRMQHCEYKKFPAM